MENAGLADIYSQASRTASPPAPKLPKMLFPPLNTPWTEAQEIWSTCIVLRFSTQERGSTVNSGVRSDDLQCKSTEDIGGTYSKFQIAG